MGAAGSVSCSAESSIIVPLIARRGCRGKKPHATPSWTSLSIKLWKSGSGAPIRQPGALWWQASPPAHRSGLQRVILVAGGHGHRLHHFELVAADEIEPPIHSRIRARAPDSASRPTPARCRRRAVHQLHEIIEQAVVGLHIIGSRHISVRIVTASGTCAPGTRFPPPGVELADPPGQHARKADPHHIGHHQPRRSGTNPPEQPCRDDRQAAASRRSRPAPRRYDARRETAASRRG